MKKISEKNLFYLTFGSIVLCEIISFIGFFNPLIVNIFTSLVILITIFISLKKPAYGFLILLTELIVGSQGYLLWFGQNGNHISLRIALWIVVMSIWIVRESVPTIKNKKLPQEWLDLSIYFPFLLFLLIIIASAINGFILGNDQTLIFIEAKRWLYFITIIPLVLTLREVEVIGKFYKVVAAACLWVAVKSLILLYIFSHGLALGDMIYAWTRANLLGEITKLPNGFSRVFLQAQVFMVLAFIFSLAYYLKSLFKNSWQFSKSALIYGSTSALFLAVIIISLSRSFWAGIGLAVLFIALVIACFIKPKINNLLMSLVHLLGVGLLTIIILFITLEFPIPKPLFSFSASLLKDRATEFEAAAASRWALLPVITNSVLNQPISGYGLGKTLTYKTSDPRITRSSIDGTYTTNAFEWGWLDIWLKLGIFGMLVYLWFLMALGKLAILKIKHNPYQTLALVGSILALIALHIFTPYLNHPLGFAYLAIIMIIVFSQEKDLVLA